MYDIIGDIHGHADELCELLEILGYGLSQGYYSHPTRSVIFVGDYIDRGPQISMVLKTVRAMVEAGSAQAIMGNHEFNAIALNTLHPGYENQYLRERNEKNIGQHKATTDQLSTTEQQAAIDWFRTLPMWIETKGIRVVHACWDKVSIDLISKRLAHFKGITDHFMLEATLSQSELFQAIENVLKGKELPLPDGRYFLDKDGHQRKQVRIKWYESAIGKSYREYSLPSINEAPEDFIPSKLTENISPYPQDALPVIIGHYWLRQNRPQRLAPNVACVDYSVAKGGNLTAYRWDGEKKLSDDKFLWVGSRLN